MGLALGLTERLNEAQEALGEVPDRTGGVLAVNPRVLWLERQLANVVGQLQAMLADVEAGCSVFDMGFLGDEEFQEMLDDIGIEIANLKGMLRTLKTLEK